MVRTRHTALLLCAACVLTLAADRAHGRFLTRRQAQSAPRGRIACLASSTVGTQYPDPFALGEHAYGFSLSEHNGIIYTCRGGHIDITHLRKLADWTAYLAYKSRQLLLDGRTEFSFRMREPSLYHVHVTYPDDWQSRPAAERETLAHELAVELAQHLAYTCSTWHEILTWFGFKGIGFWPEYTSAFSWEDSYSNVLGCRIGAAALRDPERGYCEAVTVLLNAELLTLGVQPKPMARRAGEAVRGWWFTGDFWSCDIVKRNFDVGLDDGIITPWLVPGLVECAGKMPLEYPVPTLKPLEERGFSVRFEIEPKEWEKAEVFRIVHRADKSAKRIEPARHFGLIINGIRALAVERYGPLVDDWQTPPDKDSRSNAPSTARAKRPTSASAR